MANECFAERNTNSPDEYLCLKPRSTSNTFILSTLVQTWSNKPKQALVLSQNSSQDLDARSASAGSGKRYALVNERGVGIHGKGGVGKRAAKGGGPVIGGLSAPAPASGSFGIGGKPNHFCPSNTHHSMSIPRSPAVIFDSFRSNSLLLLPSFHAECPILISLPTV